MNSAGVSPLCHLDEVKIIYSSLQNENKLLFYCNIEEQLMI